MTINLEGDWIKLHFSILTNLKKNELFSMKLLILYKQYIPF